MGFFVDTNCFSKNIIIAFEGVDELINERVEIEISGKKGKNPTIIYIRSRSEDNVVHGPSIKVYKNIKSDSTIITDIPIMKEDKEKYMKLQKYDSKICNFVYAFIDKNKKLLIYLWNLDRKDPEYTKTANDIINSLQNIKQVTNGRINIIGSILI